MKAAKKVASHIVRAILIVALVFGLVPLAQAQSLAAKGKPAAEKAKSPASAKPSGGPQEGIKVHGHWVIEVRNPDGTLVSRREFENSLQPSGKILLASFLMRRLTPGTWSMVVFDGLCPVDPASGSTVCILVDGVSGQGATPQIFPTLTALAFFPASVIELKGSFTAANAGAVTNVSTALGECSSPQSPLNCVTPNLGVGGFFFTATGVNPPVAVQQGQIVQITVTISFS